MREKLRLQNEYLYDKIDPKYNLDKLLISSVIGNSLLNDYPNIRMIKKISWLEVLNFIRNNYFFEDFLIFEKERSLKVIKYPSNPIIFYPLKFKIDTRRLKKKYPFIFCFFYSFEPKPELIFLSEILEKKLYEFFKDYLFQKCYIYGFQDKLFFVSLDKLLVFLVIPTFQKQQLKKEFLKAKDKNFFITSKNFLEYKAEFFKNFKKRYFNIFKPYIVSKLFKKEVKNFNQDKKKIKQFLSSLSYKNSLMLLKNNKYYFL